MDINQEVPRETKGVMWIKKTDIADLWKKLYSWFMIAGL